MQKSNQIFILSILFILFSSIHLVAKSDVFLEKELHHEKTDLYDDGNRYLAVVDVTINKSYSTTDLTLNNDTLLAKKKKMFQYSWMIIVGIAVLLLCIWVKERAN